MFCLAWCDRWLLWTPRGGWHASLSHNICISPPLCRELSCKGALVHLLEQAAAPSPPKSPFLQSRVSTGYHFSQLPVFGQLLLMGCQEEKEGKGLSGAGGEAWPWARKGAGPSWPSPKGTPAVKQRGCLIPKSCEAFIRADQITLKGYCAGARNAARFAFIKTNEQSSR